MPSKTTVEEEAEEGVGEEDRNYQVHLNYVGSCLGEMRTFILLHCGLGGCSHVDSLIMCVSLINRSKYPWFLDYQIGFSHWIR